MFESTDVSHEAVVDAVVDNTHGRDSVKHVITEGRADPFPLWKTGGRRFAAAWIGPVEEDTAPGFADCRDGFSLDANAIRDPARCRAGGENEEHHDAQGEA
jgi:hypothetical protein